MTDQDLTGQFERSNLNGRLTFQMLKRWAGHPEGRGTRTKEPANGDCSVAYLHSRTERSTKGNLWGSIEKSGLKSPATARSARNEQGDGRRRTGRVGFDRSNIFDRTNSTDGFDQLNILGWTNPSVEFDRISTTQISSPEYYPLTPITL